MQHVVRIVILLAGGLPAVPAVGDWQPAAEDELQVESAETVERFRELDGERFDSLLDRTHAFAVFPALKRVSALIGWASGQGILVEQGRFSGYVRQRRFSIGFQLGWQSQGQILLFRDATAVEAFKAGRINFTPQASFRGRKSRRAAETSFSPSVAVLSISESGISVEAAVGGSRFRFFPAAAPGDPEDRD